MRRISVRQEPDHPNDFAPFWLGRNLALPETPFFALRNCFGLAGILPFTGFHGNQKAHFETAPNAKLNNAVDLCPERMHTLSG